MANEPDNFADKVINSLIKQSKAVDLTAEVVAESTEPVILSDVVAYGSPSGGGTGPGSGGNKDIVIIPGYGGVAATSTSQVNFYWNAPATPDATGVDTNIRATIYNFAVNPGTGITKSVLVFGGYDGTNQYKPTPTYGGGTGVTAKIFLDPFLGRIDTDYIALNSTGTATTTDAGAIYYDIAQNRYRAGTGAATAKTFAYTDDVSTSASTATTASNINIVNATTGTFYPLFSNTSSTTPGIGVSVDGGISWNAATDTLTSGTFSGNLSATAATATNFYGTLTGSVTGTATTAQNAYVTAQTTGTFYPVFTSTSSSTNGVALSVESTLSWNAATNALTVGTLSGNLSATAATATNFYGTLNGNASTATTSTNVNVVNTTTGTFYPLFGNTSSTTSGIAISVDGGISWNAATDTLTSGTFSGNASGTAATFTNFYGTHIGAVTGTATTATNLYITNATTGTFYPVFTNASTTSAGSAISVDAGLSWDAATDTLTSGKFSGLASGTAATFTNFYGALTGNVTGTSTTSTNVNIVNSTTGTLYPLFANTSSTTAGVAISVDGGISFNSATDTLTAGTFSGNLSATAATSTNFYGTLVGTATTALNLSLNTTSQSGNHYIAFSAGSNVAGSALSTNANFYYTPSTGVLTVGTVTGTISGIASTAANLQVANSGTNQLHYMLFSNPATAIGQAGLAVSSNTSITFNPGIGLSTGALNAYINGVQIGSSSNTVTTSAGNLTLNAAGGTVVVAGNLNVQGTATYIDSTTETITDPVIVVGSGAGGTHTNVTDSQDRGIEYRRFSGSAITGFFGYSANSGQFTFIPNANLSAANTYTGTAGVIAANLTGTAVTATNFYGTLVGNAATATTAGLATTSQQVYITATTTGTLYPVFTTSSTSAAGVALSVDGSDISYNAATNTLTAGTFSGNLSATAATATNFYGTLTGSVTGTATTSTNLYVTNATTGTFYPIFTNASTTTAGSAISVDAGLSWNAATDTLTSGTFSGNLSATAATATNFYGTFVGTATTAQNSYVTAQTTGTFYPVFTSTSSSTNGVALSVESTLSWNAATNALTVGTLSGNLSATAATATNFYGTFNGPITGTATTAQNVNVVNTTTGTFYPLFGNTSSTTAGIAISVDGGISWNAATDTLTSGTFSGNASGTAATFTNFYGTHVGSVTGTATTATNINMVVATTGTFYPLFTSSSATASGVAVSTDGTDISYDAATNTLTSGKFSGLASGTAATFTNFYGALTGAVTGTATTSTNVFVTNATTGTFYPVFTNASTTTAGSAISVDAGLSWDAATDTLTAGKFSGLASGTAATFTNFYGTFVGSATTATNLNTVAAASAGAHYLLISPTASGSGVAVSTDAQLSYVPSTDTLTVSNLEPTTVSSSNALSSGTYLTLKTNVTDDASTTDFFIRGITSTSVQKFSVDANGNLRATTKSFDIEHPTKPGKRLVYGVLEGPEHGVYHRGTIEGKGELKVMLPDYWSKLVCPDYTVQLTPWGNYGIHIVEKSTEYFIISINGNALMRAVKNIKVDYIVHGSRLDAPLEIEQ